jgi:hypothetical protein
MRVANFRELRNGEVRRISIPRTSVNKGKKKGQSYNAPAQLRLCGYLGAI